MRRVVVSVAMVLVLTVTGWSPVAAQDGTPEAEGQAGFGFAPAFSNERLPSLGYPEMNLRETGSGIEGAPAEVAAGRYLVNVETATESPSYVDFVQVPAGLSETEAAEQLVSAARDDLAQEGWVYGGGSYATPGFPVSFIVELAPGEWHIGATRESVPPTGGEFQEWGTLHPLTVTESAGTPASSEIETSASVELQDVAFGGLEGPLPAGPQIWQVTNSGEQPRQMVLFRTPRVIQADEWMQVLSPMMGGTPSAGVPGFDELVWVGYTAILSPGQTMWIEFDFAPGAYSATSWVVDADTGAPALFLGMAQGFEVQ